MSNYLREILCLVGVSWRRCATVAILRADSVSGDNFGSSLPPVKKQTSDRAVSVAPEGVHYAISFRQISPAFDYFARRPRLRLGRNRPDKKTSRRSEEKSIASRD